MKKTSRRNKCAECAHCQSRVDPKTGTRHRCARKTRDLPDNVGSKPACRSFGLPKVSGWGP